MNQTNNPVNEFFKLLQKKFQLDAIYDHNKDDMFCAKCMLVLMRRFDNNFKLYIYTKNTFTIHDGYQNKNLSIYSEEDVKAAIVHIENHMKTCIHESRLSKYL